LLLLVEEVKNMQSSILDVLIVDDQPGVRQLLKIIVTEEGHRAFTATNGLEAVEFVKTKKPDIVLMDVQMPIMNGIETLIEFKRMFNNLEVVLMTAYSKTEAIEKAKKVGIYKLIAKPFDVNQIKDILSDIVIKKNDNMSQCS
jgi:two-component system, response regulator, stage 0 sporulation protein F